MAKGTLGANHVSRGQQVGCVAKTHRPARLDPSLERRRSAVLIAGLATGPPAGVVGGLGPFLAV